MSDSPARTRPSLRVVAVVGLAVVAVVVAVALIARDDPADAEQAEAIDHWSAELDSWAAATTERLGPQGTPGHGDHDLGALFDIAWTQPLQFPDEPAGATWQDVDLINAACTATTTYIQSAQDAVQPPAPPTGVDTDHPQAQEPAERFATYQQALAEFQAQAQDQGSVVRPFCGTYPALVAAHADATQARAALEEVLTCDDDSCTMVSDPGDPADAQEEPGAPLPELAEAAVVIPNERISAALTAQCYLGAVQPACTADAAEARELAEVLRPWAGGLQAGEPGETVPAEESLERASTIVEDAAAHFTEATADLGGDRAGVEHAAQEVLHQINDALEAGAQELAETLAAPGT